MDSNHSGNHSSLQENVLKRYLSPQHTPKEENNNNNEENGTSSPLIYPSRNPTYSLDDEFYVNIYNRPAYVHNKNNTVGGIGDRRDDDYTGIDLVNHPYYLSPSTTETKAKTTSKKEKRNTNANVNSDNRITRLLISAQHHSNHLEQCLNDERRQRKLLEERIKLLTINNTPPVTSILNVEIGNGNDVDTVNKKGSGEHDLIERFAKIDDEYTANAVSNPPTLHDLDTANKKDDDETKNTNKHDPPPPQPQSSLPKSTSKKDRITQTNNSNNKQKQKQKTRVNRETLAATVARALYVSLCGSDRFKSNANGNSNGDGVDGVDSSNVVEKVCVDAVLSVIDCFYDTHNDTTDDNTNDAKRDNDTHEINLLSINPSVTFKTLTTEIKRLQSKQHEVQDAFIKSDRESHDIKGKVNEEKKMLTSLLHSSKKVQTKVNDSMSKRRSELNGLIAKIKLQTKLLETLESKRVVEEAALSSLQSVTSKEYDVLQVNVISLSDRADVIADVINRRNGEVGSLNEQCVQLARARDDCKAEFEREERELMMLNADIEELQCKRNQIKDDITIYERKHDTNVEVCNDEIEVCNDEIKALNYECDDRRLKLNTLIDQINVNQNKHTKLTSEYGALTVNCQTTSSSNAALVLHNAELNNEVRLKVYNLQTLMTHVTHLSSQRNTLQDECALLDVKRKGLNEDVYAITKNVKEKTCRLEIVQRQSEDATDAIANNIREVDDRKCEVVKLNDNITTLKQTELNLARAVHKLKVKSNEVTDETTTLANRMYNAITSTLKSEDYVVKVRTEIEEMKKEMDDVKNEVFIANTQLSNSKCAKDRLDLQGVASSEHLHALKREVCSVHEELKVLNDKYSELSEQVIREEKDFQSLTSKLRQVRVTLTSHCERIVNVVKYNRDVKRVKGDVMMMLEKRSEDADDAKRDDAFDIAENNARLKGLADRRVLVERGVVDGGESGKGSGSVAIDAKLSTDERSHNRSLSHSSSHSVSHSHSRICSGTERSQERRRNMTAFKDRLDSIVCPVSVPVPA